MQKLHQYFISGNGRGLRFVFYVSLLLSVVLGCLLYSSGKQLVQTPMIENFVDSFPSLTIKDGAVQNPVKWSSYIPLTKYPVVIDTTKDALSTPISDGLYITRLNLYHVSENGLQIDRSNLPSDLFVSPAWLRTSLYQSILLLSVGTSVFVLLSSWVGYLIILALTALFAVIVRANLDAKCLWRVTSFTWIIAQLLALMLSFVGVIFQWWVMGLVIIAINVVILAKLKH